MPELIQNTATSRLVFMTDSSDHVTGKTGLTLTITASKAGGAFASITPTVTERGSGWYALALTAAHTDTVGDLALHVTATGADPTDKLFDVIFAKPANVVQVLGVAPTTSDGTAQTATSTTITLASADAAGANAYVDRRITILGGTGVGQSRVITAYNATTKVATVHRAWDTTPDTTSTYLIDPTSVIAGYVTGQDPGSYVLSAPSNKLVTDGSGSVTIQDGTIDFASLTGGLWAAISPAILTLTGATTPATAGTYLAQTTQGGQLAYTNNQQYVWFNGSGYTISNSPGSNGTAYWTAAAITGPYTANGTATGTPTVSARGNAQLAGSQVQLTPADGTVYTNARGAKLDNLDTNMASRMASFSLPANFSSILVDVNGKLTMAPTQAFNVTGTWTGNLSGSVGSVIGAVGSVAGSVGGNVVGSVGSVATAVPLGTVDGVAATKILQMMLAFVESPKTTTFDNGDGTYTQTFYAQDGATTLFSVTYNKLTGVRSAAAILH